MTIKYFIKKFIKKDIKPDHKILLENILSLFSLQGINYILPLISFPYLTRVLGPENYGLIAFALALVGYFQLLTDYGFNLSATRDISIYRNNNKEISKIFSSVTATKFLLMLISFIIMILIVFSFDIFRKDWLLYFFTFGIVIGNFLFPTYLFQGMQKMRYISILNMITTVIFTVSIFIFIRNTTDYIYVPLINSISSIIIGVMALKIAFKYFDLKFTIPSFKDIKFQMKSGWHVFISSVATSMYTISNTFILGLFVTNEIVGYYAVAEKIIRAALGLLGPISQSIYPYVNSIADKSKTEALDFIRKITPLIIIATFVLSLMIFLFADFLVNIFAGKNYNEAILLVRIMSFLPLIVALNNIFGTQTMLTFNYKKAFSQIILICSVLNIILAFILVPLYKDVGSSIAFVFTEILITILMFIYIEKKGLNVLGVK